MLNKSLNAQIHIAKKQLAMDDDTYRAVLKRASGKTSCAQMDVTDLHKALHEMKRLGFKPKPSRKPNKGVKSREPIVKDGYEHKRESQGDKIRALWLSMHEQGIVRSADEASLRNYIRRMTKCRYSAPQFCPPRTASRIIEALKKWQARGLEAQEQEQNKCN